MDNLEELPQEIKEEEKENSFIPLPDENGVIRLKTRYLTSKHKEGTEEYFKDLFGRILPDDQYNLFVEYYNTHEETHADKNEPILGQLKKLGFRELTEEK